MRMLTLYLLGALFCATLVAAGSGQIVNAEAGSSSLHVTFNDGKVLSFTGTSSNLSIVKTAIDNISGCSPSGSDLSCDLSSPVGMDAIADLNDNTLNLATHANTIRFNISASVPSGAQWYHVAMSTDGQFIDFVSHPDDLDERLDEVVGTHETSSETNETRQDDAQGNFVGCSGPALDCVTLVVTPPPSVPIRDRVGRWIRVAADWWDLT